MSKFPIMVFVVCSIVSASASAGGFSVACPQVHPPRDTRPWVAAQEHKENERVGPRELAGVAIYGGEFGGNVELVSGKLHKVKGGTDMVDFSPPTWLVCRYRGGISRWKEVNVGALMAQGRIRHGCVIQIRDHGRSIRLVCH